MGRHRREQVGLDRRQRQEPRHPQRDLANMAARGQPLRAALNERLTHEMIDTADVLPRPSRFA
jgi:hypothetical protein